jgi:hypothetical protein
MLKKGAFMEDENAVATPRAKATPTFHVLRKADAEDVDTSNPSENILEQLLESGRLWIAETPAEQPHAAGSKKAAMRHFAGDGEGEFVAIPAAHFQPKKRKLDEEPVPKVKETWE